MSATFQATGALALLAVGAVHAQPTADAITELGSVKGASVPHTTRPVAIDGVLDDAAWHEALVVELPIETNPGENVPAVVDTFVFLIEDGARLLVAFDAHDPEPDEIRAYLRDRDAAFNDDFVGVVLDTFNDQRRAFEFFVNPLGVQMDLTFDDINGNEDSSWDAIWESAGNIGENGYTVEMAIPFSQLRFQRTDGPQTWGVDLLRFYPREDQHRLSVNARERGRNCYLCQLGKVRGFADAEPGRGLQIVPSLTATRMDTRDNDTGRLVQGETDSELGVGVRWAITPDLVGNLALNPDFSQIEADVAQLDVNRTFALFFPETRPFFLEGQDFFDTPINAVFTRTIADPDVGAKLTGTLGANNFGVLAAEDAVTNLLFPGPLGSTNASLEESNRSLIGRYRRDFGENSAVGMLLTSRTAGAYENQVAGFDGRYRMNGQNSIGFQVLRSRTTYPEDLAIEKSQPVGGFEGNAAQLNYNYGTRNWFVSGNYRTLDPTFRADSGFLTQVDTVNRSLGFGRIWHGDGERWWNQFRIGANANDTHDSTGRLLSRNQNAFVNLQGPLQSFVQAGTSRGRRFWNGETYDVDSTFMFGQIRPMGGLTISGQLRSGDQVDFANSRLGQQSRVEANIEWNANRHLLIRLRHADSMLETTDGARIFEAEVTDLRATWQFNLRSFLRLTVQQQIVDRNPEVFLRPDVDARSESRATQLLYSYELNPQTVAFLGYADDRIANDDLPSLTKTGRTFFLKFSYAWVP